MRCRKFASAVASLASILDDSLPALPSWPETTAMRFLQRASLSCLPTPLRLRFPAERDASSRRRMASRSIRAFSLRATSRAWTALARSSDAWPSAWV